MHAFPLFYSFGFNKLPLSADILLTTLTQFLHTLAFHNEGFCICFLCLDVGSMVAELWSKAAGSSLGVGASVSDILQHSHHMITEEEQKEEEEEEPI